MKTNKVKLLNPFKMDISPMERLLLINFDRDPDRYYTSFEPQVFEDNIHGSGHLVIGWRIDGKVDIYHQSSLQLDPLQYDIVGKGLNQMLETDFSNAVYEVSSFGVQADYQFTDSYGRVITLKIHEQNTKKRKPFGLLAPMGDAAEKPSSMPLILLSDFYFVRKKDTDLIIDIDGKRHQPDELPLPIDTSKMLYTRYSSDPLIAKFNPAEKAKITPLMINSNQNSVNTSSCEYEIDWINGKPAMKKIIFKNEHQQLTLSFEPAFVDITSLESGSEMQGKFHILPSLDLGMITGDYFVNKNHQTIEVQLIPSKGWKPKASKLSLRFLYKVARIFSHWPKTYQWTALIKESSLETYTIDSKWDRI